MFRILDWLAWHWMDWRESQQMKKWKKHPDFEWVDDWELHKAETLVEDGKMKVSAVASTQAVAHMANICAELLNEYDAENYVEFEMLPRLDRGVRPIRVTVQWSRGMSPSTKATKLEREVERLQDELKKANTCHVCGCDITPSLCCDCF